MAGLSAVLRYGLASPHTVLLGSFHGQTNYCSKRPAVPPSTGAASDGRLSSTWREAGISLTSEMPRAFVGADAWAPLLEQITCAR